MPSSMSLAPQAMPVRLPLRLRNAFVWAALLWFSILPEILWNEIAGSTPSWLPWAKIGGLAAFLIASLLSPDLRPTWKFAAVLLALQVLGTAWQRAGANQLFLPFLGWIHPSTIKGLFAVQLVKFGISLPLLAVFLALRMRREELFLCFGDMDAPIQPVRWLGFPDPEPWKRFGAKWAFFFALGMVVITSFFGRLRLESALQALPYLPVLGLLACMNAFNEELAYRSAIIGPLTSAAGSRTAWYASAVLFGVAHYYGVPYGIAGVLLSTFMGWFLGKAMLETRGFFWPWLLHVVLDIVIFFFIVAGSVVPGGG